MKKLTSYIFLVIAIIFFNSCGGEKKSSENENMEKEDNSLVEVTQEQFNSMKMEVATLQEREFDNTIKASGKIDVPPKSRAKVTSLDRKSVV